MRRPMVDNKGRAVSWTFNEVCLVCLSQTWSAQWIGVVVTNMKVISSLGEHDQRI